jgi:stage II sporulation protein R
MKKFFAVIFITLLFAATTYVAVAFTNTENNSLESQSVTQAASSTQTLQTTGQTNQAGQSSQTAQTNQASQAEYLRIHVRANSNSETDQAVKYKVKDEVVNFLTPYVASCYDKQTAMQTISTILSDIEDVCDGVLKANGFAYTSTAACRTEQFPTRVYGDLTLEAGTYDALIIELGTGTGDNWWCVLYPPLCFTSATTSVSYRSLIYDIINKFLNG